MARFISRAVFPLTVLFALQWAAPAESSVSVTVPDCNLSPSPTGVGNLMYGSMSGTADPGTPNHGPENAVCTWNGGTWTWSVPTSADYSFVLTSTGPTASVSFTFNTGGDKSVAVTAGVAFQDTCGNNEVGSGQGNANGTAVEVMSIRVVANGTQANVTGADNWASVKATAFNPSYVYTKVKLNPDTNAAAAAVTFTGGTPYPEIGPKYAVVDATVSAMTTVTATAGTTSASLNVWVLWVTIDNKITGTTPPNAVAFGASYDGTENLGAKYYTPVGDAAVGKVVPVGTITPAGANAVVQAGWTFIRRMKCHDFFNGAADPNSWHDNWTLDTSSAAFQNLIPDVDDKIYDRDAPNIGNFGSHTTNETYNNFEEYVSWNGSLCSDYAGWYWRGRWNVAADPEVTLKDIGIGSIQLPANAFYPVP